ncbi:hypothetical protein RRG08_057208 [Elysia crispata]|uniref:Uncharacterized protein n=1 Tax=Elysia crispata TaxID=231223 RepID=A0AAE1CNC1_9GAST|nr:hypothetical protein RRG08_057208 [Elysia crispata]
MRTKVAKYRYSSLAPQEMATSMAAGVSGCTRWEHRARWDNFLLGPHMRISPAQTRRSFSPTTVAFDLVHSFEAQPGVGEVLIYQDPLHVGIASASLAIAK